MQNVHIEQHSKNTEMLPKIYKFAVAMQLSSYRYVDCHKENENIHSGTATDSCKCFLWVIFLWLLQTFNYEFMIICW